MNRRQFIGSGGGKGFRGFSPIAIPDSNKVKVSSDDTTPNYLINKLEALIETYQGAITLTCQDPAGNEVLKIGVNAIHPHIGIDNELNALQINDGSLSPPLFDPQYIDGTPVTPSLRTLGSLSDQAAAGDDARFSKALDDLTDVIITTPATDEFLGYNGAEWVNKKISTGGGSAISFFLDDTASGISTYATLSATPITTAEQIDSVNVINGGGNVLIEGYISAALGRTSLEGGVWEFPTYCKVDSAVGVSEIIIEVYKRTAGGTETLLFSTTTGEINSTTVAQFNVSSIQAAFAGLNLTDRLLIKYLGKTTSAVQRSVSLYHNGTVNYSHCHTPLATLHNNMPGLDGGSGGVFNHLSAAELAALHAQSHAIGSADHTASTIANIQSKVSGGSLITSAAGEISALTQKVTPLIADHVLLESAADSNAKRRATVGSLKQFSYERTYIPADNFRANSDYTQLFATLTFSKKVYYTKGFRHNTYDVCYCMVPVSSLKWDQGVINARLWLAGFVSPGGSNNQVYIGAKCFHVPIGQTLSFDDNDESYTYLQATITTEGLLYELLWTSLPVHLVAGSYDNEGMIVLKFIRYWESANDTYAQTVYAPFASMTLFYTGE